MWCDDCHDIEGTHIRACHFFSTFKPWVCICVTLVRQVCTCSMFCTVWKCMYMCMDMCMCRPEINLRCSRRASLCVTGSFTSPRNSFIFVYTLLVLQAGTTFLLGAWLFTGVLGIELQSSCFCSKYFTNSDYLPSPNILKHGTLIYLFFLMGYDILKYVEDSFWFILIKNHTNKCVLLKCPGSVASIRCHLIVTYTSF